MLDFLLRYINARNLLIAGLLAASVPWVIRLAGSAQARIDQHRYPPVRDAGTSAQDIKRLLEKREGEKIEARYRRVGMLLGQARADGFDVAGLQYRADLALSNNVPGRRPEAARVLGEIEMAVPHKKVQYIPLYAPANNDMMTDDDTPTARPMPTGKSPAAKPPLKAKKKGKTRR